MSHCVDLPHFPPSGDSVAVLFAVATGDPAAGVRIAAQAQLRTLTGAQGAALGHAHALVTDALEAVLSRDNVPHSQYVPRGRSRRW